MKRIITFLTLCVLVFAAGTVFFGAKTIHDLLGENKHLKKAIGNLTHEDQIGYTKVLKQESSADGKLMTTIRFVETERQDKTKKLIEKEYTIEGDVVHFDVLIVTFPPELVMDGRERSMYFWRRVYGENMSPSEGFPIENEGEEPLRYQEVFSRLKISDRKIFWNSIWSLANDPDALKEHNIKAIYGNVVYKQLQPGLIYVFKMSNTGQLYPETIPDI